MINKITLYSAAILLCGSSLICSVGLWVSEQHSNAAMILAGVFAVSLELCKFVFFPVACNLFSQRKIVSGLIVGTFALLLLSVSIYATVAFLETAATKTNHNSIQLSEDYLAHKNTIKNLEQQITTNNNLMAADAKLSYRKRASTYNLILSQLHTKKEQVIKARNNIKIQPKNGTQSIFDNVAIQFNTSTIKVRQTAYTAIAILIDVCGIFCILIITYLGKQNITESQKETIEQKQQNKKQQQITTKQQSREYLNLKNAIINGTYGKQPVIRKVMDDHKISFKKAKRLFNTLVSEQIIKQENRRYHLI